MFNLIIIIILIGMVLTLYRFIIGPTFADKIVAFDTLSIMSTSLLILLALYFQRVIYLDIALVFGLISFLGTTIYGRYIEKGI